MKSWPVLLLFAIFPLSSWPCTCPSIEHACQAYGSVPIIFAGTVVGLEGQEVHGEKGGYFQTIRFDVTEPFKGATNGEMLVVREHFASSCPSSAPDFVLGGRYLVWAVSDKAGHALVSDCNPTRRLEDAAQLVSELRELRMGTGATYIFGEIYRNRQPPNGASWDEMAHSDVPLAGTRVFATKDAIRYTATTDGQGRFSLSLPGGGKYGIETDLPQYFKTDGLSREIDLADHECADMSLWTQYEFSFSGRVVNESGSPMEGVPVELLPDNDLRSVAYAVTNSAGEYVLSATEPGTYLLALNWDEAPSETAPFATTLYPGVHDLDVASRLRTEETGHIELSDFHIPKPQVCTMQVRIQDQRGDVAKDGKIMMRYFPAQFWHQADESGNGIVSIPGDNPVYIMGSENPFGTQGHRSDPKEIRSCPDKVVILRLTNYVTVQ